MNRVRSEWVDGDRIGRERHAWRAVREAFRVRRVGDVERELAYRCDVGDASEEDVSGG